MGAKTVILRSNTLFYKRYLIVRCIKVGGMGAIYDVLDTLTTGHRALKVMLPSLADNKAFRARFAREACITGGIESDHIVRTVDAGVDEDTELPFFVMELLRGEELGRLVQRYKGLPPEDVCLYLLQVARALDKTHAEGIIHRDLKPSNLFLTLRDDGSPCVKILDFGIAKVTEQHRLTVSGQMLGTLMYIAPEQIRAQHDVGPTADIHALGHLAYTLLVGEAYWAQEFQDIPSPYLMAAQMLQGLTESPSNRALRRRGKNLPPQFDAWMMQATALAPQDRFQRASTAIIELAETLGVSLPRVSSARLLLDKPSKSDNVNTQEMRRSDREQPQSTRQKAITTNQVAEQSNDFGTSETLVVDEPLSTKTPPFQAFIDEEKNILKIKLGGVWTVETAKAYMDQLGEKACCLNGSAWYVLADITSFRVQSPEVMDCVLRALVHARANGMKKAASLVNSALTRMQVAGLFKEMRLHDHAFFASEHQALLWLMRDRPVAH